VETHLPTCGDQPVELPSEANNVFLPVSQPKLADNSSQDSLIYTREVAMHHGDGDCEKKLVVGTNAYNEVVITKDK